MTPFRYTAVGQFMRSTKETTRSDVAAVIVTAILLAAVLGVLSFGIYMHALNNLIP